MRPAPTSCISLSPTTPRRSIPNLRSSPFTQQRHRARSLHDSGLLCVPDTMQAGNGMAKSLMAQQANKRSETFQMVNGDDQNKARTNGDLHAIEVVTQV